MSKRTLAGIAGSGFVIAVVIAITAFTSTSSIEPVRLVMPDLVRADVSPNPSLSPELYVVAQLNAEFARDWTVDRLFVFDDETGDQVQAFYEVPSPANEFSADGFRYAIPNADPKKSYRLEYVLWPKEATRKKNWSESGFPLNVRVWTEYVKKDRARDPDSVANAAKPTRG